MTGTVLTVAGGKGGVGKTTTVINAGIALQETGLDVCLIDADLGMGNLGPRLDVTEAPDLHDVLAGEDALVEAVAEGPAGLTVLAGDAEHLEAVSKAEPAALRPVIEHLRDEHDLLVVDTGAGLSHEALVAAHAADGLLLVTTPDEFAARDTHKTGDLAERVDADLLGAVVTRAGIGTDTDALADQLGVEVLATIGEDREVTGGEPALLSHPDSRLADDYADLGDELAVALDLAAPELAASD
jgi:septum site-determining protein MinD